MRGYEEGLIDNSVEEQRSGYRNERPVSSNAVFWEAH